MFKKRLHRKKIRAVIHHCRGYQVFTPLHLKTDSFILRNAKWREAITFYQEGLSLPVNSMNDRFVEFSLNDVIRLTVADEGWATLRFGLSPDATVALEVDDIHAAWTSLREKGLSPGPIQDHSWSAPVFLLVDPAGHHVKIREAGRAT